MADGTVLGNVILFSGYTESLDEVTCACLTDTNLDIGDCCVGLVDTTSISITHHLGSTWT